MEPDPTLTVLIYSSLAALTAVVGVVPQALVGPPSLKLIGWANALAAGLMFGVAYTLLTVVLPTGLAAGGLGSLLGIGFVRLTHALTGTGELDLTRLDEAGPEYGYKVILCDTLHAAHEGIAIGVAMVVSLPLGISMAVALGVHNVPEAMILSRVLTRRDAGLPQAAGLAIATNINQVLLAVVTFAVVVAAPVLLPWVAGFAVGALTYLVLVELLPESYRQAGHTSIALVTVVAMGVVVLLTGTAA
ncbi:MAG: ZIP family metal transporter [Gemmatimonadetes bacterium]|nr:ZIP family metal transporter [Gemmatimonadota bacterium]NIQ54338.1 ZIP family metal transporter [Gemmatimonadota bacterium]NIU74548.1 ZIP family metal transporter [Gammaproteobacteria bacterium]NIX44483.1 ZIP family metal transporter [Gemmatimonadota bacterium]NIY08713.1 ZIP family metal transporter [Gemmatimonadota bacterium]